eukprot:TRINITY_DN952_c3_g1_i1.p1 TRINITY_DN952_c3_g1~~TRINITY_DN952_c3_g1_i1.p1  ORF type:complete len:569 (+),score=246.70 TRINITY_DN952_c3_g1_i1:76-1782(+)
MPPRAGGFIRRWDKGSRQQRINILSEFLHLHRNSTGAEIERDLGASAMLFFTRITAWLRLTYMLNYELSVQLSAISLFLQGQRFLTNFMEVGGIQTLLDILCHRTKNKDDKQNALLILIHIANSGRVCREMICDDVGPIPEDRIRWAEDVVGFLGVTDLSGLHKHHSEVRAQIEAVCAAKVADLRNHGYPENASALASDVAKALDILTGNVPYCGGDMLCEALLHERNETTLELYGSLFMALGQGNPRKRSLIDAGLLRVIRSGDEAAQLCAATTLRSLQMAKQHYGGGQGAQVFGLIAAAPSRSADQTPTPDIPQQERRQRLKLPNVSGQLVPSAVSQQQGEEDEEEEEEDPDVAQLVDTLSRLLHSENVKLRFEGTEFLITAAQNDHLLCSVVRRMCSYIDDDGWAAARHAGSAEDEADTPRQDDVEDAVVRRRRASSARVIARVLSWRAEHQGDPASGPGMLRLVVDLLEERKVYVALLRLIRNSDAKDIDTQRECATALQRIVRCADTHSSEVAASYLFPDARAVVQSVLPPEAFAAFEGREEFDIEYLRALREELLHSESGVL